MVVASFRDFPSISQFFHSVRYRFGVFSQGGRWFLDTGVGNNAGFLPDVWRSGRVAWVGTKDLGPVIGELGLPTWVVCRPVLG